MSASIHTRRTILKALALMGAGAAFVGPVIGPGTLRALALESPSGRNQLSRTAFLMNTTATFTIRHAGTQTARDAAEEAISMATAEMERLIAILSRFDPASPLSVLNDAGRISGAPEELVEVLGHARNWHGLSDGVFDPTILPLLSYMERRNLAGEPVDMQDVASLLDLVGADGVRIDGRDIRLDRNGMQVTLDGIAKGYIVDRGAQVLSGAGMDDFLINAGGDLACVSRPGTPPWRIAIEDPAGNRRYPDVISLRRGAVATSGVYEVFFTPDRRFTHIIDPSQGIRPLALASASVRARTVMEADILATAAMAMQPAQALSLVNELPGRECLLLDTAGTHFTSNRWA